MVRSSSIVSPRAPRTPVAAFVGRLALIAAGLVLGCLVLEVGARLFLAVQGRAYSRDAAVRDVLHLADQMTVRATRLDPGETDDPEEIEAAQRRQLLHPFLGWEVGAYHLRMRRDQEHFASPAARATFDVLLLGGSVAANFGNQADRELVRRIGALERVEGRPVRLMNYARGSYKQPQQLVMLTWLLSLGFQPDLVINLDGFNEVAVSNANRGLDAHPLYPAVAQWAPLARGGLTDPATLDLAIPVRRLQVAVEGLARGARGSWQMHSAVLGSLRYARVRKGHAAWVLAQRRLQAHLMEASDQFVLRGPHFEGDARETIELCVRAWLEGARMLHQLCAARGIPFVACLQPTLHDEGAKPLSAEEREKGGAPDAWLEGVRLGYPLLRAAGRVLEREGVCFIDATRVFGDVEATLYYDACHFDRAGNHLLAEYLVAGIAAHWAALGGR